jgi:hypothetical protein
VDRSLTPAFFWGSGHPFQPFPHHRKIRSFSEISLNPHEVLVFRPHSACFRLFQGYRHGSTLAQSKTLARTAMAFVNAKRLGVRWPATAFPQRRVSSTSFRKQNRNMICGRAFTAQVVIYLAALIGL